MQGHRGLTEKAKRLIPVALSALCTSGTGVNLWGGSPLYENLIVFIVINTNFQGGNTGSNPVGDANKKNTVFLSNDWHLQ